MPISGEFAQNGTESDDRGMIRQEQGSTASGGWFEIAEVASKDQV
ncbi:hypothetical protein [Tsuneonella sp. SYSU-LHT278]